ncbi:DUF3592 domain-containing protein [Saccharothrix sp. NRRL B-16348]|uniref:DUF3592 domain-containing protein n=1 Tax=Saccharothrix sp. NRRL B-16348 TaxID=1415542 RepID=UPI000AAF76D6|nr:DUF3592 domain-containing protein [Saccharothrix sp. NRRL B-16348]
MLRAVIFIVCGVAAIAFGGWLVLDDRRLVDAQAEVLRVSGADGGEWKSTVRFTTADGEEVTETLPPSDRKPGKGDRVAVSYRRTNPSAVHFPEDGQNLYLWPGVGLGLIVVGVGSIFWYNRRPR